MNNEKCCDGNFISLKRLQKISLWILTGIIIILTGAICLGYILDPPVIRILWLVINAAMLVVVVPLGVYIVIRVRQCSEECDIQE